MADKARAISAIGRRVNSCDPTLPRRHRTFASGFTIVEMLVVLLIIGIVAAAATPRFSTALSARRVEAAARRIVADLEAARTTARMTSQQQTITFDLTNQRYTLVGMPNADQPGKANTVSLSGGIYSSSFSSVSLGGDATLIFNGYGIPDSGGSIVVQSGGRTKTINIEATTGATAIQ